MTKKKHKLTGTGVALVTPFYKDGSIDFKCFKKVIENCISQKVDYLVPLGTTGESVTLNPSEKQAVIDFVLEVNDKRLPVVLGLGGNNTQSLVTQISQTDFDGIEAILSVSPYYNKPNQKGVYQHYKMIANECPVPVILYNVPGRTGSNLTPETTLNLANDFENIIGIKEASGNIFQIMEIIKNKPDGFLVISGDDGLTMPLLTMGADGVISVLANAYPKHFSTMVRYAMQDKPEKARPIHYALSELIELLFVDGSPGGIKSALKEMGICDDYVRMPLAPVGKSTANKIAQVMSDLKKKLG
ncbi:MAG TPA: 4-hydroxy-tetrahydrodipicolinate synthase [Bacteroidia bacterium]|nr:4-hydroxy-tetrahydrodipicolinate synthase [Bacteroidia bacterium]HNT79141.1 4-hydroxy-tetrahydrodipicolinate synthase [Bacteroidia bacterium]